MPSQIKRGEIYWVDWNPGRGSEQRGKRPTLIIQNDVGNKYSTTIVAACSTAPEKPYPFVVQLSAGEGGLSKDGSVNLSRIMTIDVSRLLDKVGELSEARMAEVDVAIKISLGLA
jgi:mRNA interferase MazF